MAISGMRGLYVVWKGKGKSFKGAGNSRLRRPLLFGSKRTAKKAEKIFRYVKNKSKRRKALEKLSIGYGTILR